MQGLGGLGVAGMGQAAAVSPVTSFQTAKSSGHFGAIVVSGEAMAAGPEVRRDHAEHRQEPLGCTGCAEAFHGAFALPGRLVRVLRPVELRYCDCRCSTDGVTSRCATA